MRKSQEPSELAAWERQLQQQRESDARMRAAFADLPGKPAVRGEGRITRTQQVTAIVLIVALVAFWYWVLAW